MSCESRQEQAALFVDGELEEADQVGLFRHLETCAECRTQLNLAIRCRQAIGKDRESILRGADALPSAEALLATGRPAVKARALRPAGRFSGWLLPVPIGVGLALVLLVAGALLGARLSRTSVASRATDQAGHTVEPAVVVVCGLPEVQVFGSSVRP